MLTMTHEALITLIEARCTLTKPKSWTKGTYARDAKGEPVDEQDDTATCYCMMGAMWKSAYSRAAFLEEQSIPDVVITALRACEKQINGDRVVPTFATQYNDRVKTTHKDVLKVIDGAIVDLKSQFENELKAFGGDDEW